MSVINKMLNDLEGRDAAEQPMQADYVPPKKTSLRLWIYSLLAVIVILFGVMWWWPMAGDSKPVVSTNKPELSSQQPVAVPEVVAPKSQKNAEPVTEPLVVNADTAEPSSAASPSSQPKPQTQAQTQAQSPMAASAVEPPSTEDTKPTEVTQGLPQAPAKFVMQNTEPASRLASLKQQVAEAVSRNDNFIAIDLLNELLGLEPDNINARKKLASLYFSRGKYALAQTLLEQGVSMHPQRNDFRLMLSRVFLIKNDYAQAFKWLVDAPFPDRELLDARAPLAQQLGKIPFAIQDYQQLVALNANSSKAWLGLATTLDQLGQAEQALVAYSQLLELGQISSDVQQFVERRVQLLSEGS